MTQRRRGRPTAGVNRTHIPTRSPSSTRTGSYQYQTHTRPAVFARYGRECIYCGDYATQVDHLTPVSAGGTDDLNNLRPACASCNNRRGARGAAPPRERP